MLRKLSFRTKLLCTLAVPMVALLAITAIVGRERLDKANAADRLGKSITLVASTLDLDHAVQRELAASADPAATDELAAARAATDAAASTLVPALGTGTGATAYDHATSRTRSDIKSLASARGSVDKGAGIGSYSVIYTELTSALADLTTAIGDNAADPALARQTAALAALARVADATAIESAVIESGALHGTFAAGESGLLHGAVADRTQWEGVYDGLASDAASTTLRSTMIGDAVNTSNAIETNVLRAPEGVALGVDANAWRTAMASRLDLLHGAETTALSGLSAAAAHVVEDARADLRNFWIIAMASVVISMALGLLLTRSITRPLRKLTTAARLLADEQLPALVEGLKSPGPDDQRFLKSAVEPIDVRSDDELGQLAQAFNAVQAVAVDVAAEQAELLRKGIGDIFVSLARRNQVLIDRQIEFLDELEAAEDDPDQLSSLYRLDHLATRMRRNAESLLVLAGIEPTRRRAKPVALIDVVRAAIGETEDYARVELLGFEEVGVAGTGAVDLGHLLAEILENATHFSPPDSKVTVEGRLARNGYVVAIVDQGIGMSIEQLAESNRLLSTPPPVGLALGRSLGFTVIARLAARHGVAVRLMPAPGTGTSAAVYLPPHLVVSPDAPIDVASMPASTAPLPTPVNLGPVFAAGDDAHAAVTMPSLPRRQIQDPEPARAEHREPASATAFDDLMPLAAQSPTAAPIEPMADEPSFDVLDDEDFEQAFQRAWGEDAPDAGPTPADAEVEPGAAAGPVHDDWDVDDEALPTLPRRTPAVAPVDRLEDALPSGNAFDRGLADLMKGDDILGPPRLVEPPVDSPPAADPAPTLEEELPPIAAAPPAATDMAPATSAPIEAEAAPAEPASVPMTSAGLVRRVPKAPSAGPAPEVGRPAVTANRRSPDDVRAMLSKYRGGLQKGRVSTDDSEEGRTDG